MQYFIGIDGGGTKSRLIIGDEKANKVSVTEAGSINIYSVGLKSSLNTLKTLINSSLNKNNIDLSDIRRICIASAGLARPKELNAFKNFFLNAYPTLDTIFTTDIMALMFGALNKGDGICLISGTGSVAMGQDIYKHIVRSGGFGWRLGDEGSASFIAQEAIKRSIKSYENRDLKTNMINDILSFYKLEKIEDTIQFFHNPSLDKATVAASASIVTKYAQKGDLLALDILKVSAKELFNLVLSVQNRLTKKPNRPLIIAGGVFEHDEIVRDFFIKELDNYNNTKENENNTIKLVPLKTNALDGALYIAINKL